MKNSLIKSILLGAIAIGMMVGCDDNSQTSSQLPPSSNTSSVISSSPSDIISSSTTSSSISSSSTSSSSSSVAPTLTGITLDTTNVKKTYNYGDKLNLAGLVVTANYSDNSTKAVTDYTTDPANESILNTHGEVTVKVTYQSFDEQFTITVDKVLTEITLNTDNVKKDYYTGDALDLTGLEVTAKYSDNTTSVVADYTANPANGTVFSAIKEETVTITYQQKTATFKVTVTKAPKTAWTDEEAAFMASVLYGEVLPYTGFEESQVRYNPNYNAIVIMGGAANEESLLAYSRELSYNGYLLVSSTDLVFEKSVMTENGKRFIQVTVMSNQGQLAIVAMDPYYYEFPADFATYAAKQYFASEKAIPAIQADYYSVVESQGTLALICYMESTTDDAGYSAILGVANWKVQSEKVNGNYVAVSPDDAYMILYTYDAQHQALLIIYSEINIFWNEEVIKAFFAKYNGTYVDVPALNVAGGQYSFAEAETNEYFYEQGSIDMVVAFYEIYGATSEDAQNYMTTLKDAGYKVLNSNNSYSATKAVEGKGLFRIDYSFDPNKSLITIIFYIYLEPFPTTEFPQDEISEALGGYLIDTVPGFVGETTGFQLNDDSYGLYIVVEVEQGTELAAIEAYKATLVENGYSLRYEGSSEYLSEHHEIVISLQKDAGSFKIIVMREPYNAWPTAQIAAYLGEEITDAVPTFEDADADTFAFEVEDDGLWITIHYDYEEDENGDEIEFDMEEAANNYVDTLKENGFFKIMEDENGNEYYVSKNLQVVVEVEYDDVWDEICVFINTVEALTAGKWPEQHIAYFLDVHHYTDELPTYEGEFVSANATIGLSSLTIDVVLDTNDADEIKAAADAYIATLEEEGFKYFESLGEGRCKRYYSPNKQYEVSVMYQPNGFTVQIDEMPNESKTTTTFPTEELYADHPELEGVLPTVVDGEATFDTTIQSDWVEIFVMYEDTSLIPSAMEAYAAALVEAGFIPQADTAGYEMVYFDPDYTYYVALTDWSDYDTPGFNIEIHYL